MYFNELERQFFCINISLYLVEISVHKILQWVQLDYVFAAEIIVFYCIFFEKTTKFPKG